MMCKRIKNALLPVVILLILCVQGCACPQGTELSKRLIVEAVGVDLDDGAYKVTLQALDAHAAGQSDDPNENGSRTRLCSFTGATVGEALAGAAAETGLTPLYSQARVLVLGRSLAEQDVSAPLDFFLREYHTRSDILIAVADASAADILAADPGGSVPGAVLLEEALLTGSENGECCAVKLFRFTGFLLSETDTAYCPVVRLRSEDKGERPTAAPGETAFFQNGRLAFTAGPEITRGLLFLTDAVKKTSFTVRGEDGAYTLRVAKTSTTVRARKTDTDGAAFTVNVTAVCDITEFAASRFPDLGETQAARAQTAGTAYLQQLLNDAFGFLYGEHGADVCRLARRAALRFPKKEAAFREELARKTADIRLNAVLTVRRTGKENLS